MSRSRAGARAADRATELRHPRVAAPLALRTCNTFYEWATVPAVTGTTTRSGRGTRAADTAARKRRLLDAATELAAEGGYDAVQMRDVAARAEVALGTLYRHYTSKDQLLLAALAQQAATLRERLDQRPPRGATAAERVSDVLRRASRALERQPRVIQAMLTAMSSPDDTGAPVKLEINETLRAIIADAVDGEQLDDLDDIMQVLGAVWFAELTFWSIGIRRDTSMGDNLARAASLLLDHRTLSQTARGRAARPTRRGSSRSRGPTRRADPGSPTPRRRRVRRATAPRRARDRRTTTSSANVAALGLGRGVGVVPAEERQATPRHAPRPARPRARAPTVRESARAMPPHVFQPSASATTSRTCRALPPTHTG